MEGDSLLLLNPPIKGEGRNCPKNPTSEESIQPCVYPLEKKPGGPFVISLLWD